MSVLENFIIRRKNKYNFDKKRFLISVNITLVQIITYKRLKKG